MKEWLIRHFKPCYDEIATFLMAVSFGLLYVADLDLRQGVAGSLEFTNIPRQNTFIIIFSILLISGFCLSFYHVFSKREKNSLEKIILLIFAMTMNGVAAITSGMYLLKTESGLMRLFTLWNIVNGFALLYQIGMIGDDDSFSDIQASVDQIYVGLAAIIILFYICYIVFNLHWAITFSISVCYATTISRFINFKIVSLFTNGK